MRNEVWNVLEKEILISNLNVDCVTFAWGRHITTIFMQQTTLKKKLQ